MPHDDSTSWLIFFSPDERLRVTSTINSVTAAAVTAVSAITADLALESTS